MSDGTALGCTFCDLKGHSTSVFTAHFRRFIPELLPMTTFRKVRTTPDHPIEICREYLRQMGAKKWTEHLAAPASDVNSPEHRVLEAFGKVAVTPAGERGNDWAGRDYGLFQNDDWAVMIAEVLKEYVVHGNTVKMELHAKRLVLDAINATFTPDEEDDDDDIDELIDVVDEDLSTAVPASPLPVSVDDAEATDDAEPTTQFSRRRANVSAISNRVSSMNKRGRDWHNTEIGGKGLRFDMGVNSAINFDAAASSSAGDKFENFALILLVVKMFGSVIQVPAGYNTSLAQVIDAAQRHKGNPLGDHRVSGGLRGTSAWAGLWDDAVWKKAKMEARSLQGECSVGNPTCCVYHVEFVVLPDPMVVV